MAMVESLPLYGPSRHDLLFARRRRPHGGQPPRKGLLRSSLNPPEPPNNDGFRFDRRTIILGGSIAISTVLAGIVRPWERFTQSDTKQQPESYNLESLVTHAIQLENEFRANDLSDDRTRNNFSALIADIYSQDAPSAYTKEQIAGSIVWAKNSDEFIKLVAANSLRQLAVRGQDYFRDIAAIHTDNNRIVLNLANPAFNTTILRRWGFPRDWNALKSLRRILLHELVHLTTSTKKDTEFFALTDLLPEAAESALMEGFTLRFQEQNQDKEALHILNEVTVETITSERSNRLFGQTPPIPYMEQGVNIAEAQLRMKRVLNAAGISIVDLERFNRSSDLYGFLKSLSSRVNFSPDTSQADKIDYVLNVLDAILYNNQNLIQEYPNRTKAKQ